jgi:hypothetical protein
MEPETNVGSIIQIRPTAEVDNCWKSVLMIVEEVKKWGVLAFDMSPTAGEKDMAPNRFYMKLTKGQYDVVGTAQYLPEDVWAKVPRGLAVCYQPVEGA